MSIPLSILNANEGQAAETHYAYKASLIGSAQQFELADEGLVWTIGGKSASWRYEEIAAVRLSYRPVSMQSRRFRSDIENVRGESLTILSTSWQTVALMATQDEAYRSFVTQLHWRLAGGEVALVAGLRPGVYILATTVVAILAVALTGLMIRAILTGQTIGAFFILGFAALFAWQIGGFMRRNRPRNYTLDSIPKDLLP